MLYIKVVRSKNKFWTHCVPLDKHLVDWPKTNKRSGNLRPSLKKYLLLLLPTE